MKNRRNYYRILQVQPDASQPVIHASYKAIMRALKVHPDLGGTHWHATIVNEAFSVLRDSPSRIAYDRELFERYTKKIWAVDRLPIISYFCPFCKRPLARQATANETCPSCRSPLASPYTVNHHQEQRAVTRLSTAGCIQLHTPWSPTPEVGHLLDLTPQGMRFQCRVKLLPTMTIRISSHELNAVAAVRHSQKIIDHGTISYATGVVFLTVQFTQPKGGFHSSSA